ncbi:hypothetical protein Pst134EB_019843 [Puccinia striiformis f. sp. tritici]|uniref:Uncharacterized protein n=1 Tax=Puccinia striiformis f. sp. tritici PST-78 TaxID=1165861 RepID=A0A0L0VTN6_9BASI|nr:hypothetical protein Pst134EB_019843 [Puccinia striiformis f. sp. tritici]KNF02365.1 hypothetical protein PSTG_04273 [Puccinia striiformis f. sp. tritici PST-78]
MHRWSEWETMDMLNIMKANPSSFLDKAFWKRMSDFLHEAGQKDQTHNAVKSKWSKCGIMIDTLKHLLKKETTTHFIPCLISLTGNQPKFPGHHVRTHLLPKLIATMNLSEGKDRQASEDK